MIQDDLFILRALWLGFLASFCYDCIRVFRRLFPHGILWISLEDALFWLGVAATGFRFLHREGNGTLRWFAVLGMALGIWLYGKLLSPLFLKISLKILRPIRDFLKMVLTKVLKLLKMIGKGVMGHVRTLFNKFKKRKKRGSIFQRKRGQREQEESQETGEGRFPEKAGR